jgi:NitT/TauT family transport system substrate-binding protein
MFCQSRCLEQAMFVNRLRRTGMTANPVGFIAKTRLSRVPRVALALSAALVAAAVGSTAAQATRAAHCSKVDTLHVAIFPGNINGFGIYIANGKGFFAANCIKVVPVNVTNANAALAASVQGGIDIAFMTPDVAIAARSHGLNVQIIGSMLSRIPNALVVTKGTPLPHGSEGFPGVMQDLVGKRIGVTALGSGTQGTAEALFQAAGLSPTSATYVPIGGTATELAALANHTVDAAIMFGDGQDVARAQGFGTTVADLRLAGPWGSALNAMENTAQVYVAQQSFINGHAALLKRFLTANHEALAWSTQPKNLSGVYRIIRAAAPLGGEVSNFVQVLAQACKTFSGMASDRVSHNAISAWNTFAIGLGETGQSVPFQTIVWSGSKKYWTP